MEETLMGLVVIPVKASPASGGRESGYPMPVWDGYIKGFFRYPGGKILPDIHIAGSS
jgi:hypothetical protein